MERYISLLSLSLLDSLSEVPSVLSMPSNSLSRRGITANASEPGRGPVRTAAIRRGAGRQFSGAGRQFSGIGGEKMGALWRQLV
jgi:hypothetical protein